MILKICNYGSENAWHMVDHVRNLQWIYKLRSTIESEAYSLLVLSPPAENEDTYFCSCHYQDEKGEWIHIAFTQAFLLNDEGKTIERL